MSPPTVASPLPALPHDLVDWEAQRQQLQYAQIHREDWTVDSVRALMGRDRDENLRRLLVAALIAGCSRRVRRRVMRRGALHSISMPRKGHPELLLVDSKNRAVLVLEAKLRTTAGNELFVDGALLVRVRENAADVRRAGHTPWDADAYVAAALAEGYEGAVVHQLTAYVAGLQVSRVELTRSQTTWVLWTESATKTAHDLGYGYVPLAAAEGYWETSRWHQTRASIESVLLDPAVRSTLCPTDVDDLTQLYRMLLGR